MDIIDHTKCLLMRMSLATPVTVTLWGPSVLSVLRMTFILTYAMGRGRVSAHVRKAMQEKNVIAANLAIRITRPVSPVGATQWAVPVTSPAQGPVFVRKMLRGKPAIAASQDSIT